MDFEGLKRLRADNNEVAWLVSDYLNDSPCALSDGAWHEVCADGMDAGAVFAAYMAGIGGLELDDEMGWRLYNDYLLRGVKRLDVDVYRLDPYYRGIRFEDRKSGRWELSHSRYAAYEGFVCGDLLVDDAGREIPQVGFFEEEFCYPVVKEDGREWMAIKPSEVESMRGAVAAAHGKVVTFGLGLGYFAYMVSLKEEVEEVTVVERDESVIGLFEEVILPQFKERGKVHVVRDDAFHFMEYCMGNGAFDFAFVDLWHDTLDGKDLYLHTKDLEHLSPGTEWQYWVEELLLSSLRWDAWDRAMTTARDGDEAFKWLHDRDWLVHCCKGGK